jgi:hypothetical protein
MEQKVEEKKAEIRKLVPMIDYMFPGCFDEEEMKKEPKDRKVRLG